MGVGLWGDVVGVWSIWGGPVCCPWDSQGDGGAVSVSFAFRFGFLVRSGCDFGGRGAVWGGVAFGASCRSSNLEGRPVIEHSSTRV